MHILILNGSPRNKGNSEFITNLMQEEFLKKSYQVDVINVGKNNIRGCLACHYCRENHNCVIDDLVNQVAPIFKKTDALIMITPVYYAMPNGNLISFLQRLFYSTSFDKRMKVGASVAIARRAGTTFALDCLNKFFTITEMPIASSFYWNNAFGLNKGEVQFDEEGISNVKELINNVDFLVKSIAKGKKEKLLDDKVPHLVTNFMR